MPPASRPMSLPEWAMLLSLATVWGGSFFFNRIALRDLPVFTVVLSRVALAALILLVILRLRAEALPAGPRVWAAFFGMGLLNNVIPFTLIVAAQQHIASGVASILNAATPLFTVLLAHIVTRDERMTRLKLISVLIGFAGVAVMIGTDAISGLGGHVMAQLMCLAAALSYACAGLFGRRFRQMAVPPMATATGQLIAATILLTPIALLHDQPWTLPAPPPGTLAAVVGLAVLSTALAYVLYFRLLATAGATNVALVTFLVPVSAILLGTLILHEALLPRHLAGMALIALGLALMDGRLTAALRRR